MQEAASHIILGKAGPSDRFTIRYGIFRFQLSIKPLTARQIIKIGECLSDLKDIDTKGDMFPELLRNRSDLRRISRAIAVSTGTRFTWLVARAILDLPLEDFETLFRIVRKQSDPAPFFFISVLARGQLNVMKTKKEQQ